MLNKRNNMEKKNVKLCIGNKLFSATWIKADKKPRTILGKLPTNEKFFNGGELKGNRDHLLEVIDMTVLRKTKDPKKSWRSINLNTLTSLKIRGIEWVK
tara:strand:- start:734 stop:1030 length:297 start_codon:yes stop_codon:yes gene_type:complete